MTSNKNKGVLPEKISVPRPETGAFGQTSPGAVGESQGRDAVLAAMKAGYGNAVDLGGEKHINTPGPDFQVLSQDEDGQPVIVAGDVKDMKSPNAARFDAAKMDDYLTDALNNVAKKDSPEPLPEPMVVRGYRNPGTEEGYLPEHADGVLPANDDVEELGFHEGDSNNHWDVMMAKIAADFPAAKDEGALIPAGLTTSSQLSEQGADRLRKNGLSYMHVENADAGVDATGTDTAANATGTDTAANATGTDTAANATGTDTTANATGTDTAANADFLPEFNSSAASADEADFLPEFNSSAASADEADFLPEFNSTTASADDDNFLPAMPLATPESSPAPLPAPSAPSSVSTPAASSTDGTLEGPSGDL